MYIQVLPFLRRKFLHGGVYFTSFANIRTRCVEIVVIIYLMVQNGRS